MQPERTFTGTEGSKNYSIIRLISVDTHDAVRMKKRKRVSIYQAYIKLYLRLMIYLEDLTLCVPKTQNNSETRKERRNVQFQFHICTMLSYHTAASVDRFVQCILTDVEDFFFY